MLEQIDISSQDILDRVKLDCQIPELIERIVTCKIIANEAEKAGIEISNEEIQQEADRFRATNQLNSAEDTKKWLEGNHLSLDDFGEIIYNECLAAKLAQHLFTDQIEPYFFANYLEYTGAVIKEVVLEDEDLAIELYYAIYEREISFDDVAFAHIQDKELRRQRGYLGLVSRQDLKPEIATAVFAAKPPEILKPIATSAGFHLITVQETIEPKLDEILRDRILQDLFSQWIESQIATIKINFAVNLLVVGC